MIMYVMYVNNNSTNQIQCHSDVHCSGIPILSLSDIERLHILKPVDVMLSFFAMYNFLMLG